MSPNTAAVGVGLELRTSSGCIFANSTTFLGALGTICHPGKYHVQFFGLWPVGEGGEGMWTFLEAIVCGHEFQLGPLETTLLLLDTARF